MSYQIKVKPEIHGLYGHQINSALQFVPTNVNFVLAKYRKRLEDTVHRNRTGSAFLAWKRLEISWDAWQRSNWWEGGRRVYPLQVYILRKHINNVWRTEMM